MTSTERPASRYRVDKFVVPQASREEFLAAVWFTHGILRRQPGFVRDLVLDQISGSGEFNIVTLVEWADSRAFAGAVEAVRNAHAGAAFDGGATMARLGVRGDMGVYAAVDAGDAAVAEAQAPIEHGRRGTGQGD